MSKDGGFQNWDKLIGGLWNYYEKETPQRTKLIDAFMVFLVAVGVIQFVYCLLISSFVRNALHSQETAT